MEDWKESEVQGYLVIGPTRAMTQVKDNSRRNLFISLKLACPAKAYPLNRRRLDRSTVPKSNSEPVKTNIGWIIGGHMTKEALIFGKTAYIEGH